MSDLFESLMTSQHKLNEGKKLSRKQVNESNGYSGEEAELYDEFYSAIEEFPEEWGSIELDIKDDIYLSNEAYEYTHGPDAFNVSEDKAKEIIRQALIDFLQANPDAPKGKFYNKYSEATSHKMNESIPEGYKTDTCPCCGSDNIEMEYGIEEIELIPETMSATYICNDCGCKFSAKWTLTDINITPEGRIL